MTAAFKVELTEPALADLTAIRDWMLAEAGPKVADRLIDSVLAKIETLEQFPSRGALVPEFAALGEQRYRQLLLPPYRLIYRVRDQRVIVRLIVHNRRDLHDVLHQRLLLG